MRGGGRGIARREKGREIRGRNALEVGVEICEDGTNKRFYDIAAFTGMRYVSSVDVLLLTLSSLLLPLLELGAFFSREFNAVVGQILIENLKTAAKDIDDCL